MNSNNKKRNGTWYRKSFLILMVPLLIVLAAIPLSYLALTKRQDLSVNQNTVPETESLLTGQEISRKTETDRLQSETEIILPDTEDIQAETEILYVDGQRVVQAVSEEESESEQENSDIVKKSGLSEALKQEKKEEAADIPFTVVIDPGHQGSWVDMSEPEPIGPGASQMKQKATTGTEGRFTGLKEYELTLSVSQLLRAELLQKGFRVIMTREDHDTAISNKERALLAAEMGGDIFVRIHANGSDDTSVSGALAMVPSEQNPYVGDLAEDSYQLAGCILDAYCKKAEFRNLGIQYQDEMSGINWSEIPVMILEMGFMSNQEDDTRMADETVQKKMAEGIAEGIEEYFAKTDAAPRLAENGSPKNGEAPGNGKETENRSNTVSLSKGHKDQKIENCLETIRDQYLTGASASGEQWAVAVMDLGTGAYGDINGMQRMPSASVIKVFLMAAVFDRIYYPSSEETRIPVSNDQAGSLDRLLTNMITVSDNEAANTLLDYLGGGDGRKGMEVVNSFCRENGYTGTSFGRKFLESNPSGDNYTTASDCMKLLVSIYQGTCVNRDASGKMYELMRQQTRTWKIPAGLSGRGNIQTANKTGELYGEYNNFVENDIAIITSDKADYVLAVLSSGLRSNDAGQAMIQNISGSVYDLLS